MNDLTIAAGSGAHGPALFTIGWTYRADIPAKAEAVSQALVRLNHQLIGLGLAPDTLIRLELVLAEVLNNIVEHAYGDNGSSDIAMEVSVHSNTIWCHLVDQGQPMPGGHLPPARRYDLDAMDMLDLPEGGFGWGLIRDMTGSLSYARVGLQNQLNFSIDLDC